MTRNVATAPSFSLTNTEGTIVTDSDYCGKWLLIVFLRHLS